MERKWHSLCKRIIVVSSRTRTLCLCSQYCPESCALRYTGVDEPCLSAYSFLFSWTSSVYLEPNLPSSRTVTITAGGFPEGTWFTVPIGPPRLCLEPPRRARNSIITTQSSPAIAMIGCRYRRGSEKPRRSDCELLWRGRNGAGFDDFRDGYGKCMACKRCGCRRKDLEKRKRLDRLSKLSQVLFGRRCRGLVGEPPLGAGLSQATGETPRLVRM